MSVSHVRTFHACIVGCVTTRFNLIVNKITSVSLAPGRSGYAGRSPGDERDADSLFESRILVSEMMEKVVLIVEKFHIEFLDWLAPRGGIVK